MDLNSEKNLEMAEVLLSALNPAARATLWLKVVKSQKEISLPSSQKNTKTCVHFLVSWGQGSAGSTFLLKHFF